MSTQRTLITGGEGGLGRALAAGLNAAGLEVLAPGRDELDVADGDSVKAYVAGAGELDLLVCNAGVTRDGLLAQTGEDGWDEVMQVNLRGAFLCAREAVRGMMKRRCGHVVFVSSFSALHPPVGQVNYASAKAGLLGMMKSMAQEVGSRGVRVNAVLPGFLETKMTEGVAEGVREAVLQKHVLGSLNTVESVADFVAHLHLRMPHTSGQVFNLDSRVL